MTFQALLGSLDVTGLDAYGVQWSVHDSPGLGAPRPTIAPVMKPRQSGAWAGLSYSGARHVALSGIVVAPTQDLLTAAFDRLIDAASLDTFVLTVVEGSRTRFHYVRREDEVITAYITDTIASWSIQFVALDPRKFGTALTGSTLLPSSTGGLTVPFTVPFTIASTVVSGQVSLTNPGNATGSVILRIDGPCTGPVVTRTGVTGSSLIFASSLVLNAGEWLTVNGDKQTALANDQANRASYITARGWPKFEPGVNVFSFAAPVFNAASLLTVTGVPADK
jgi:hypothetical protein